MEVMKKRGAGRDEKGGKGKRKESRVKEKNTKQVSGT